MYNSAEELSRYFPDLFNGFILFSVEAKFSGQHFASLIHVLQKNEHNKIPIILSAFQIKSKNGIL